MTAQTIPNPGHHNMPVDTTALLAAVNSMADALGDQLTASDVGGPFSCAEADGIAASLARGFRARGGEVAVVARASPAPDTVAAQVGIILERKARLAIVLLRARREPLAPEAPHHLDQGTLAGFAFARKGLQVERHSRPQCAARNVPRAAL